MILYPLPSFLINLPVPNFDESTEYVKQFHSNSYDIFVTASSCHAAKLDLKAKSHYIVLIAQVLLVWIVGGIVVFKIHRKLDEMKGVLSPATMKARKQLLIALCFQGTIPSILIVVPVILTLISAFLNANSMSIMSTIAMPIISLHSMFNALSIVYIITPYRKAVWNIITKIFRIKQNSTRSVTAEITNSNIGSPR